MWISIPYAKHKGFRNVLHDLCVCVSRLSKRICTKWDNMFLRSKNFLSYIHQLIIYSNTPPVVRNTWDTNCHPFIHPESLWQFARMIILFNPWGGSSASRITSYGWCEAAHCNGLRAPAGMLHQFCMQGLKMTCSKIRWFHRRYNSMSYFQWISGLETYFLRHPYFIVAVKIVLYK